MIFKKNKKLGGNLPNEVLKKVSEDHGVSVYDVTGRCRKSELVDMRCVIASVLHKLGQSESAIGRLLERDHTTVINLLIRTGKRRDLLWMTDKYLKIFK